MRFADFFAGAGGASTGIEKAGHRVVVAVNHDQGALNAHRKNHPHTIHLNEDIREVDPEILRSFGTDAAWASPDCTHHSGAKGGTSRDADSRMLAEVFVHYARVCGWKMIFVENVREFIKWGPIIPKRMPGLKSRHGQVAAERRYVAVQLELMEAQCLHHTEQAARLKVELDDLRQRFDAWRNYARDKKDNIIFMPDAATAGSMYFKWLRHFNDLGYDYDYRLLNSADYGAAQSRNRYFGVFIKRGSGLQFSWPRKTHAKVVPPMSDLKPWVACKTILDLDKPGPSIFTDVKPLVEASLGRIITGLQRYAHEGDVVMIDRYHSGSVPSNANTPMPTVMASMEKSVVRVSTVDHYIHQTPPQGVEMPLGTAMASRDKYLAQSFVIPTNYSNTPFTTDAPLNTVLASKRHTYLCRAFIAKDYSSGGKPWSQTSSVSSPIGTVLTGGHLNLVVGYLTKYHGNGENVVGMSDPCSTITTKDRLALVESSFVMEHRAAGDPNSKNRVRSTDGPLGTITTCFRPGVVCANYLMEYYGGMKGTNRVRGMNDVVGTIATENHPAVISAVVINGKARHLAPERYPYILRHHDPSRLQCPWTRVEGPYEVDNRILDIRYRMLNVQELMRAQGFPEGYFLDVPTTRAKKYIGNAVQVDVAHALVGAMAPLEELEQKVP